MLVETLSFSLSLSLPVVGASLFLLAVLSGSSPAGASGSPPVEAPTPSPEGGPVLWGETPLAKVMRDARAPSSPEPVRLEGSWGETVSGQAVFRSPRAVASARTAVTGPRFETGVEGSSAVFPPDRVRLRWVRYLDVKRNSAGVPADELVAKAPCSLPDPFWDADAIPIAAGSAQPVWVEVEIPRDATPGVYTGTLSVTEGDAGDPLASVPVRLVVWDFEMPAARHQQVTNWFDFPGAGYAVERDSEEYWRLARRFAEAMVAHRQTCFRAGLDMIAARYDPKDGFACDFRFLDRWAETFFGAGMERMELFQAGRSRTTPDDPEARVEPAELAVETAPGASLTPEERLRGVLGALEAHVREKGWTGRVMIHVQDEPYLHMVPTYRKVAAIVREAAPSLRIIEAVEATGFGDAIDVLVPKLSHLNLWFPYFQDARARGHEIWFYTCCHPVGRYANRFLDQPLLGVRQLHWIGYLYGLDGYLHWGLNYFAPGVDPYSEEGVSEGLPLGDRAIMYPGREGPVGSLRWSVMRDGLQDYETLRVLEERLAALKRRVGGDAAWLDPRQRPLELCRRVVGSFYERTRDPEALLAARRAAAEEIAMAPPLFAVQTEPPEGTAIPEGPRLVNVRGIAQPGSAVTIDGRAVDAGESGVFAAACFLNGPSLRVEATREGRTRAVTRTFRLVE